MHFPSSDIPVKRAGCGEAMKLLSLCAKKVLTWLLVLLGVTFISFLLIYLAPGDAAEIILSSMGPPPTEAEIEAKREDLGLDRPFVVQYVDWVGDIAHGDLGTSVITGRTVSEELRIYLPKTLLLASVTMLLTVLISVPLGIFCAVRKDSLFDKITQSISYFMVAWPSFFLALVVLYFFGVRLRWLPISRSEGLTGLIMPVVVMTAGMCGWYIRQVRTIALEQINQDYVLGLKARGIPHRTIMARHVLKNSWTPIFVLLGMSFGGMLGGTAIVECIFSWEGIGFWAVQAISKRNYPVIQGYVLWMALIYLLVNFLVEVLCAWVNPRIRSGRGGAS